MALTQAQKKLFKRMFWQEQWWGQPSLDTSEMVAQLTDTEILIAEDAFKAQRIASINARLAREQAEKIELGG